MPVERKINLHPKNCSSINSAFPFKHISACRYYPASTNFLLLWYIIYICLIGERRTVSTEKLKGKKSNFLGNPGRHAAMSLFGILESGILSMFLSIQFRISTNPLTFVYPFQACSWARGYSNCHWTIRRLCQIRSPIYDRANTEQHTLTPTEKQVLTWHVYIWTELHMEGLHPVDSNPKPSCCDISTK